MALNAPYWLGDRFIFTPAAKGGRLPFPKKPGDSLIEAPTLSEQIGPAPLIDTAGNSGESPVGENSRSEKGPQTVSRSPSNSAIGGAMGSLGGLLTSVPGLGLLGGAIGTHLDMQEAKAALDRIGLSSEGLSFGKALANNQALGLPDALGSSWSFNNQIGTIAGNAIQDLSNRGDQTLTGQNEGPTSAGGFGGGVNDAGAAGLDGGLDSGGGGGFDSSGNAAGWARGGRVTRKRLVGPNPPGPDDGYGALDVGEEVLTAKAAKIYPGLVRAANAGLLDPAALEAALRKGGRASLIETD